MSVLITLELLADFFRDGLICVFWEVPYFMITLGAELRVSAYTTWDIFSRVGALRCGIMIHMG